MEAKPKSAKRSGLAVAVLAVPLLLVGYVLSSGPAIRVAENNGLAFRNKHLKSVMLAYRPIGWACDACPPFQSAMNAYVKWWVKDVEMGPALRSLPYF